MFTGQQQVRVIKKLEVEEVEKGQVSKFFLHIISDGMGLPVYVPIMVARGVQDGPILGLTAAVHGNELNGVSVIQRLFRDIDPLALRGTIVGVPVVNIPGFLQMQRPFNDGNDLNRIMPGREDGNSAEVYAHRLVTKILYQFDYLIDLHTASFGRINSYYVRANLNDPDVYELAQIQNAQILLHSPAPDATVRGNLTEYGVKSLTLEVGDPNRFQRGLIRSGLVGLHNTIIQLGMEDGQIENPEQKPIVCDHSYWIFSKKGGILQVLPEVTELVSKGQVIAIIRNIFGEVIQEIEAPEDGVVIGKHVQPVAQTGTRILHLGIIKN
ncbi:MAG TPA: succinylglutamate desuccinylase/aspartoacylase family protein [Saprospiraceae bacterium]|nr:succinylglutamate desuccinylase/aspartoacylase family protein [Saprospiraceae bacterium]HMQ81874.1 succinylglutamate desuccinylase/aspartoacylase family protein [Saprospiraceae bacterium]